MEAASWDSPSLRAWADAVSARFESDGRFEPARAARAGFWFLGRVERGERTQESVARRFEPGEAEVPGRVIAGMAHCSKPFQLWNVYRQENRTGLAFEPGPVLKVGEAAKRDAPTGEGMPGRVTLASAVARRESEEVDLARSFALGSARRLRLALSQDLAREGLGRRENA